MAAANCSWLALPVLLIVDPWAVLGRSWAVLGAPSWSFWRPSCAVLGPSSAALEPSKTGRELNLSSSLCSSLLSLLSSPPFPLSLPSSPLPSLRSLLPVPPLPPSLPELASREASGTSQVRDRLRRNGPQRHASGVSGIRVARASQAKRAGRPREVFFLAVRRLTAGKNTHPGAQR